MASVPHSAREQREAAFWDYQAQRASDDALRGERIGDTPIDLRRLELLGRIRGRSILDLGCGTGLWAVHLAERGARVTGLDVSSQSVRVLLRRAELRGAADRVGGVAGSAVRLPFPANSFDAVQGQDLVHHIEAVEALGREVMRVLRPGGVAVFSENSGRNALLMLARRACGHFGIPKWSSPDEHPLTRDEATRFGSTFDAYQVLYPHFVCVQLVDAKFFEYRRRPIKAACRAIDATVARLFPFLRPYSYRQIIVGWKHAPPAPGSAH
jgi:ubiquinone/menaquinone biosynthesis C-methylase UbiE